MQHHPDYEAALRLNNLNNPYVDKTSITQSADYYRWEYENATTKKARKQAKDNLKFLGEKVGTTKK